MTNISTNTSNVSSFCVQGELFRFDKNFASNMDQVSALADDGGGGLLRSVLYYLADSYQHNILDIGLFDVDDFAKKYGFSVKFLRNRHPSPYHLQNLGEQARRAYRDDARSSRWDVSDSKVWDSYIENALYLLMARPFTFDTIGGFFRVDESIYKATGTCQVLRSLSAIYVGKKLYYRYELNGDVMRNLSSYYANVNRQCLIATRKSNLDVLYLAVQELKTAVGLAGETRTAPGAVTLDRLRELAKISAVRKSGKTVPMSEIKFFINKAFDELNASTDIKCRLIWERLPNTNFFYSPVIVFFDESEMSVMHPGSQVRKMREKNAVNDVLKENLIREFYQAFREVNRHDKVGPVGVDVEQRFTCWFFSRPSSDSDRVARRAAFITACLHAFNHYPNGVDAMFERFLKMCLDSGMDDVVKFLDKYISETRAVA